MIFTTKNRKRRARTEATAPPFFSRPPMALYDAGAPSTGRGDMSSRHKKGGNP